MSGTEIPDSTRLSASMIWLSVNRDFFISVDPFRWKKFYFLVLRIFGGITRSLDSLFGGPLDLAVECLNELLDGSG
jgi:hypothetical protein